MRTLLRTLIIGTTALIGLTASGQFPYTWIIQGQVSNCYPGQQVQLTSAGNMQPSFQLNVPVDVNCTFNAVIGTYSQAPSVLINTWCGAQMVFGIDSVLFNNPQDTIITNISLTCGTTYFDCAGTMNGSAVQGNPCYYGDPFGSGIWDSSCNCVPTSTFCDVAMNINQTSAWNVSFTCDTTGAAPFSYQWTLPDGTTSSSSAPAYTFSGPGTYTVCITITSNNGCNSTACDTLIIDNFGMAGTVTYDCNGILNGGNLPGTACDDGDPFTTGDTWDIYCNCTPDTSICQAVIDVILLGPWMAEAVSTSSGAAPISCLWTVPGGQQPGPTSNVPIAFSAPGIYQVQLYTVDGNGCQSFATDSLYVDPLGNVSSTPIQPNDCLGVPGGPALPGTPCNDNDPNTVNDTWNANCICAGTAVQNCQASFTGSQVGPWLLALSDQSSGVAPISYLWWLPDGSTSSAANPLYNFNAAGTYGVCLVITAGNACTSTLCDTVYVDSNGTVSFLPQYVDCMGYPNGPNLPGTPCQIPGTVLFGSWDANCTCDTSSVGMYDCTGILNGPNMPGTACVDTVGGVLVPGTWQANCLCVSNALLDCTGIVNGPNMPGTPCNDNDTTTVQDTWSPSCVCVGVPVNYYDCLQIVNGPNLPGTPCNDNNPATIGDTWDANCNCQGSVPQPCNADFWVLQAYTTDSITNLPVPTPNELWVWNLSSGGTGAFSFLWSFGDGTSSTDPFPTHTYANGGPYILCLTINDSAGCTSTHCDSVSVDANGMYTGMLGVGTDRASGFTLNVRDPLATGVQEVATTLGELALWPNPVQDALNIALVSELRGSLTVDVLDLNGRLVRSERHSVSGGHDRMTLNMTGLDAGLYILRIGNGTTTISQRFVKTE